MWPNGPWAWFPFMWIFPLIMLVVMLFVVYLIFGRGGGFRGPCWRSDDHPAHRHDFDTPIEILKRRYAKGEITKDEFERMKNDILS